MCRIPLSLLLSYRWLKLFEVCKPNHEIQFLLLHRLLSGWETIYRLVVKYWTFLSSPLQTGRTWRASRRWRGCRSPCWRCSGGSVPYSTRWSPSTLPVSWDGWPNCEPSITTTPRCLPLGAWATTSSPPSSVRSGTYSEWYIEAGWMNRGEDNKHYNLTPQTTSEMATISETDLMTISEAATISKAEHRTISEVLTTMQ